MRKSVLPLLSLYLDFIWINALVGLADHVLPWLSQALFGQSLPWAASIAVSLLLLGIGRMLGVSVGGWLLSWAADEREAGVTLRQWPNLVLGTLAFLSGLKEMVRWVEPGNGLPFLLMVEETPLKIAALMLFGAAVALAGIMLLRFMRGARLVNSLLIGFAMAAFAVNMLFSREAMVTAAMTRRANQGLPATLEQAEGVVSFTLYAAIALLAVCCVLLFLCRERPQPGERRFAAR